MSTREIIFRDHSATPDQDASKHERRRPRLLPSAGRVRLAAPAWRVRLKASAVWTGRSFGESDRSRTSIRVN